MIRAAPHRLFITVARNERAEICHAWRRSPVPNNNRAGQGSAECATCEPLSAVVRSPAADAAPTESGTAAAVRTPIKQSAFNRISMLLLPGFGIEVVSSHRASDTVKSGKARSNLVKQPVSPEA